MQIKKINNDKLKIILSSNDLSEKNIDIDSFLSNSVESQNLFFEILDLAEEEYDFNIENNKAIVETISLDNNIFVLTITKLKNDTLTYQNSSRIYCFNNIDDIFHIDSLAVKELIKKAYIYKYNDRFYLIFEEVNPSIETILSEFSSPVKDYSYLSDILIEYGEKIN